MQFLNKLYWGKQLLNHTFLSYINRSAPSLQWTLLLYLQLHGNIIWLLELINFLLCDLRHYLQKQPPRSVLRKRCSENMRQIYRRIPMPKCDFNKVALQLYWNRTSAWASSCKFAAYFQNTFFKKHLWVAASVPTFCVAHFDSIGIEYFMKVVRRWEMLV